jgi:hypothetical protein
MTPRGLAVSGLSAAVVLLLCAVVVLLVQLLRRPCPAPAPAAPAATCDETAVRRIVDASLTVRQPAAPIRVALDQNAGGSPPETYAQVGYLTPAAAGGANLPLYGQRSVARRDRWYYYTIAPGGIKMAVVTERDCLDEVGCAEIYDGDAASVKDGGAFVARVYKNNFVRA